MDGLMMDIPLTVPSLLLFAVCHHGDTEIVSCTSDLGRVCYSYADAQRRANRLSNALCGLGIERGDRVGTPSFRTLSCRTRFGGHLPYN
jgi:acyl-CoA synthetase (AMP-forming)/AMP-acid ligase II